VRAEGALQLAEVHDIWEHVDVMNRALAVMLLLIVSLPLSIASGGAVDPVTRAQENPIGAGYWHTEGTHLVDAAGNTVRLNGVTWYGMDSSRWVPAGLDFQPYTNIMDAVKLLGYNAIRLTFSNELVERNPVVSKGVQANPQFRGLTALEVLDAIVNYAQRIGLKIILDNHRSRAARPTGVNTLDEAFWYTPQYPESSWIRDWETLATRYLGNDAVIAFDLRNEPHTQGPGPWDLAAYLQRSATWGRYRGVDDPTTDWRLAAERAGNVLLGINSHLLIIVEGLAIYPNRHQPNGVVSSWWAGILTPAKRYPVVLQVPHQLVYSVHDWGPQKYMMPQFTPMSYASLQRVWHRNWSFLLDHPDAPYAAPVLLGEFGTCTELPACVEPGQPGAQGTWLGFLLRFLREHAEVSWSFYALNGTNSNNCYADNGLLNAAWNNVSNLALQGALRSIQSVPGLMPDSSTAPLIPGATTNRKPRSPTSALCRLP
jgi:endoglucanase